MQTFQELMTAELASAGLNDAEVTAALSKIYANDKLGPKLNALVKTATEDYQAQLGRVKQYQDWYPKAQAEYDRMATEYNKAVAELTALQGGGNGGGNGQPPAFDASKYVSKDDLLQFNREMGTRYAGVIKDSNRITAKHVSRFKEEPDFEAIDKIAQEQNLPIAAAYDKWIEPRVKEEEKAAKADWEKKTREEIERDVRSRHNLPIEHVAAEQSPLFRKGGKDDAPKDMDAELLAAWHNTPAKV